MRTDAALETLPMKFELPLYVATIDCGPSGSAVVFNTATPDAFTCAEPSTVVPSVKVTVPSGEWTTGVNELTVAVNVTGWPTAWTDGAVNTVFVPAFAMTFVTEPLL